MRPSGSAASSPRASCRRGASMSGTSERSEQPTLPGIGSATSSPASAAGPSLCASPAGPRTAPSGPPPSPASPFHRPANAERLLTSGIYGLSLRDSSPSAALQQSLESRLLHALAAYGSLEYALTWKRWAIGSGPAICALRASAPRTSGNGSTGWPTAQARDHFPGHSPEYVDEKKAQGHGMANLNDHALLAGWPTPDAQMMNDSADLELHLERLKRLKEKHGNGNGAGMPLGIAAKLAHPPREREERRAGRPRRPGTTEEPMLPIGRGPPLPSSAGWPTPKSSDGDWATPMTSGRPKEKSTHLGTIASLSPAPTAPPVELDAAFSRWLQGYPAAWDNLSPRYDEWRKAQELIAQDGSRATATPSSRPLPRSSSSPRKKRSRIWP